MATSNPFAEKISMMKAPFVAAAILAAATLALPARAQDAMKKDTAVKPAPSPSKAVLDSWNDVGRNRSASPDPAKDRSAPATPLHRPTLKSGKHSRRSPARSRPRRREPGTCHGGNRNRFGHRECRPA